MVRKEEYLFVVQIRANVSLNKAIVGNKFQPVGIQILKIQQPHNPPPRSPVSLYNPNPVMLFLFSRPPPSLFYLYTVLHTKNDTSETTFPFLKPNHKYIPVRIYRF